MEATISKELIARYQQAKEEEKATIELLFSNYIAWLMQEPDKIHLENLDQLPKATHIYQLLYAGLTYIDTGQLQQFSYIIKELGAAGKINNSAYTHKLIKEQFSCAYRGKINVKGKGNLDMYFVE